MSTPDYNDEGARRRFYNSSDWKGVMGVREQVLARDNYECVWCKAEGRTTTRADAVLEVDHIIELEKRPDLALDIDNLRTLCRPCHNKRHDRFGKQEPKENLSEVFKEEW